MALRLAMQPRERAIADDHDPTFLHPGRVALILLRDVETVTSRSVLLGVVLESRDRALRVSDAALGAECDPELVTARAAVPEPGAPDLAERLVTLPADVVSAALAERLDHLRHEHLRVPAVPWSGLVDEVERVWLPVSERTSPILSRRYGHWLRTFRRRL